MKPAVHSSLADADPKLGNSQIGSLLQRDVTPFSKRMCRNDVPSIKEHNKRSKRLLRPIVSGRP